MSGRVLLAISIILLITISRATIINVPGDQSTIQAGIDAATHGDTVLVQPGTYVERINFNGKNIVVGSLLLMTGDTSFISQTVIDGGGGLNTVVAYQSGEDSTAFLCGFTITNGGGYCYPEYCIGGGIVIWGSSPSLSNLKITGNEVKGSILAGLGGGIYCRDSSPKLEDVTISHNSGGVSGGGIYCDNSTPTFINVSVYGNRADVGGGISFYQSTPQFDTEKRCNIYHNYSFIGQGGDLYSNDSPLIEVVVDTFTVMVPNDERAYPHNDYSFDIQHAIIDPVVSSDLYVSPEGSNSNSGLSLSEPLKSISHALLKVEAGKDQPHTVFLANGEYGHTTTGEYLPLQMMSYVSLVGESEYGVVLNGENLANILYFYRDSSITIKNVTITDGSAVQGGGIYSRRSDPTFINMIVSGNEASTGGGLYFDESSITRLETVTVRGNSAGTGGGVYCRDASILDLINVTVSNNIAYSGEYRGAGGGIHCSRSVLNFNQEHRSNIYFNRARLGNDLYAYESTVSVILDTFTVLRPTSYYVTPLYNFTSFDIQHAKMEQIDSDLYVSPQGNDTNGGQSPSSPLRTISNALSRIYADNQNRPTIHLSNGVYSPSTTDEEFPIYLVSFVSLMGESENGVILTGEGEGPAFIFNRTTGISVESMTITDFNSEVGAIYCETSSPGIKNVTVTNNEGTYGSGMTCDNSSPNLENVTLSNNRSYFAGGIYLGNSSPELVNVLIIMNTASSHGGGIYCMNYSNPNFVNVTISGNSAACGGGIYIGNGSNPNMLNTILWDNSPNEICFLEYGHQIGPNSITIAFSNVQEGKEGIVGRDANTVNWLEGNIELQPLFCDPTKWDYSLGEDSPCAGTGEEGANMGALGIGCEAGITVFELPAIPEQYSLFPAYPNPFNPISTIRYDLPEASHVSLIVYDLLGREVARLVDGDMEPDYHQTVWNGRDATNREVPSGIYIARLVTPEYSKSIKMVLLK